MRNTIFPQQFSFILLFFSGCSLFLTACANNSLAYAKFQTNYSFSTIKSYSVYERNSDFSDFQNISDATRNSIEIAIEKALDSKGFQYKSTDEADVVIGYHLVNKAAELKKYNKGVRFCGPCLHAGSVAENKRLWKMSSGSLILDVVSKAKKRSVWRSVYPLKIKDSDNSFEIQDKILQAINAMVNTIPKENT